MASIKEIGRELEDAKEEHKRYVEVGRVEEIEKGEEKEDPWEEDIWKLRDALVTTRGKQGVLVITNLLYDPFQELIGPGALRHFQGILEISNFHALKKTRVQIWLYEQVDLRIEGQIIGFDEFMNLVLDDAEEINVKKKSRKSLGRILLKGDNITLIQSAT
nr:13752_t:CDS:2 [Entrophospora candida]